MKAISKRELNQQTAQVLAAIEVGDSVLITEDGAEPWPRMSKQAVAAKLADAIAARFTTKPKLVKKDKKA